MNQIVGECRTYSAKVDTHEHPYAQLILPLQGELFIKTPEYALTVDQSRLFYLSPHTKHSFFAKDTNQFLVLDIPKSYVQHNGAIAKVSIQQAMDERWQALRALIWADVSTQKLSSSRLWHLVSYASSLLQTPQNPPSLQHILNYYNQPLSLEQLARLEGYTVSYYCEWFKKLTGETPHAYLQRVRLHKAQELLQHTELSILEVAQAVGYEHHASLTRLFRQRQGLSPQQYRQRNRILDKQMPKSG
ncbi:MAG TPA: AraC family transcriptional regulator [Leptolyngbyaceae cyanobacterium]